MKLIYNDFNKQTGESIVILADKYGRYVGKAKCHPDDKEYVSEFMGCNIAERRAQIKSFKNKLRITKIKINTVKIIFKDIKNQESIKIISQYIKNYETEIKKIEETIKELEFEINERIRIRDNIIKKVKGQQN